MSGDRVVLCLMGAMLCVAVVGVYIFCIYNPPPTCALLR